MKNKTKNVRLYEFTTQNGHGSSSILVPAQSSADVKRCMPISEHQKHIATKSLSWSEVEIDVENQTDIVFHLKAKVGTAETTVREGEPGYDHIAKVNAKIVDTLQKELDVLNCAEY